MEPPDNAALIPVIFNNTTPTYISYSLSPLGDHSTRIFVNLTSRDLKHIEKNRSDALKALRKADILEEEYVEDDYYDYNDSPRQRALHGANTADSEYRLEKTETLQHIKVSRPGVIRLEKALGQSNTEVRIRPTELTVVQCPRVEFVVGLKADTKRCTGSTEILDLKMYGVAPLTLKWHREVSGRREHFLVEGIEGGHPVGQSISFWHSFYHRFSQPNRHPLAQELQIPLSIQLEALGRHVYTLDALIDGVGNSLDLSSPPSTMHTSQSVTVLRRSAMSFKSCGPGRPASLLIGKETPLLIVANDADIDDGPWDITIKYQPPLDDKKKSKPWQQDFKTPLGKRELTLLARAPGEYTLVGVKGRYCPGDILSPESCRVIEQSLPTADIEWKRIHEWWANMSFLP